jgi:hypothetical protein
MMRRSVLVFGVALVLILGAIVNVAAQEPSPFESPIPIPPLDPPGTVPSLEDVVFGLAGALGLGAILSFLFEKFAWFQRLESDERWWVICGLSVSLPVLAQLAIQFVPADVWQALEPYWQSLARGFLAFFTSQLAHWVDKRLAD